MIIRLANKEEYEDVSNLILQVHQIHTALRPDIYKECEVVLDKKDYLDAIEENRIYVGMLDNRIIGVTMLLFRNVDRQHQMPRKIIFIDIMVIDQRYRGSGYGALFFEFLKELKLKLGYDAIELQVNARNVDAIKAYTSYGFINKSINMELPDNE